MLHNLNLRRVERLRSALSLLTSERPQATLSGPRADASVSRNLLDAVPGLPLVLDARLSSELGKRHQDVPT
jgi:hypothetical protein